MASDTEKQLLQLCTNGSLPSLKDFITKQQLNPNEVKDSSGLTLLHLACRHGHLDIVQYLTKDQNCSPETTTPNGRTPLHIACKSGHLHIVKCLITDHKCNPHCTDNDGYTPLHAASESGNIATVNYLITAQGCDPQVSDSIGNTPLHYASESGHLKIVQCLITEFNCDPQTTNSRGSIPLHYACTGAVTRYLIKEHQCSPNCTDMFGNTSLHLASCLPLVKYLIDEHACNPQTVNNDGLTPLHYACLNGHLGITKYLILDCNCTPQCYDKIGNTPLHYACHNGHLEVAKYLITEHKCSPEHGNVSGYTPLHFTASNGHLAVVKYFICELECNAQITTNDGLTPLHYACLNGHFDITKYLISDCNCNPQCYDKIGNTPLHCACLNDHLEVAKYLITEHKCSPEYGNVSGYTPLHSAASNGHLAVVKYLISELDCDPQIADKKSLTPLHFACLNGHLDVTKYLISDCNGDPQRSTHNGNTPLHYACQNAHLEVVKYLITEHNCSPEHGDVDGYTPLHLVVRNAHLAVMKYLISELGCNPEISDSYGFTPLHDACLNGHLDITKHLISECNCNPQCSTNKGNTPLHCACQNGHLEVAKYLITEHKCSPEHGNVNGITPLHSAASKGHLAVVKYLISELGCDPQIADKNGLTPLHFACLNGHLDVTKYLISDCNCNPQCYDKIGNTPLHCACHNGHLEVAQYLITEHKCSPEHGNVSGYTPLHFSASNGHLAVVKYLICELECNAQITTNDGLTPLHYACLNGHFDITKYLISDCNCNPQCYDKIGNAPLHCACQNGHLEIVKYLITEHKCSPEHGNVIGYTPLHSATRNGHLAVVKHLISQCNCNPECCDMNGCTILHEACVSGHLHITKYLVQEENCAHEPKAIINDEMLATVTKKGLPLQNLLMTKAYETFMFVKYMHGSTRKVVISKAIDGITPLHFACIKGHLDTVKYLINTCECNPNYTTSNGLTAIDFAQICRHTEVVNYLRDECQCSWSQVLTSLMLQAQQNPLEFNFSDCLAYNDKMCISPLQQACIIGDLETVKSCIAKPDCNPSSAGLLGLTPLHTACMMGHLEIAKYLVFECKCDPNCAVVENTPQTISITSHYQNTFITPLTVATAWGQLNVIKWFVSELKCNPECNENSFPLDILACMFGQLEVLKYLLHKSDSRDLPHLLFAGCCFGDLKIAKYLIDVYKCKPHSRSDDGAISLHFACINMQHLFKNKHQPSENITTSNLGIKSILLHIWHAIIFPVTMVTQLLTNFVPGFPNPAKQMNNYDILSDAMWANRKSRSDEETTTPNLDIVKYLITEHMCNPQCTDKEGQTPLHYACASGQLEIVEYFHSEKLSDLVHKAHSGDTPLHFACKYNQVKVAQFLLSTGECDPLIKNVEGMSPVEIASSPEIRKLLDHFCKGKYPLELVVKVFVLGDPMAGKSSLVQAIQNDPGFLSSLTAQKVQRVRKQTAGINLFSFSSSDFGDVMIYDFVGQREFHSSHAAFLQNYSTHMTGVFIIVTSIAQCEDNMCQSLHYWVSFIQDCCTHNEMKSHVIFVGSHADQLDKGDIDQAFTTIEQGFSVNKIYETEAVICLDCTQSASPFMNLLRYHLTESCNSIRERTEKIDQRCYVLHKYVHKACINKSAPGCRLKSISKDLEDNQYLLPSNPSELLPLFQTLHDKGQVLLLKNSEDISDSWVITNISAMLEMVVGSIFAPHNFPQHIAPAAGSTGIVPKSKINEAFPDLNIDMVIGFLEHFEFCHQVGADWVDDSQSNQLSNDEYYLFPALLTSENIPDIMQESCEKYCCGWFVYSTVEAQFFTTQFLHILLLRLAFLFAPPEDSTTPSSSRNKGPVLSRRCTMWKNGISWPDTNGMKACFEVKDLKTVTLTMTCLEGREHHCVRLRTKLIRAILETKNEFCPHVDTEECIVEVTADNLHAVLECPSHGIKYLSSMIVDRDPKDDPDLILTHSDGSAGKRISELLCFEPYAVLTSDLITQLFAKENAKKLVSSSFITELASRIFVFNNFLEEVLTPDPSVLSGKCKKDDLSSLSEKAQQQLRCKHILETWMEQLGSAATYRKLRQELNKYSIFCGRNPLDMVCINDYLAVHEYVYNF